MSHVVKSYPYVERDLIQEPESYMYSAYGGMDLLRAYGRSRGECRRAMENGYLATLCVTEHTALEKLRRAVERWAFLLKRFETEFSPEVQALHRRLFPTSPAMEEGNEERVPSPRADEGVYSTRDRLRGLLAAIRSDGCGETGVVEEWLELFLRRYEVTKRVYGAYRGCLVPADGGSVAPTNYALLSIMFLCHYDARRDIRYLNAALKLNDSLCSVGPSRLGVETLMLTLLALVAEAAAVECLGRMWGIGL